MIFVDTKRFSPVVYENDMPDKRSPLYRLWWKEQYRRCIHGYKVSDAVEYGKGDVFVDGENALWDKKKMNVYLSDYRVWIKNRTVIIPGRLYWYLNFWPIYGIDEKTGLKGIIKPRFLDIDYEKAIAVECMFRDSLDDMEAKARQKGFSEWIAAVVGWFFTFVPGSQVLIIAGEERYSAHTMSNVVRGLDDLVDTEFYKHRMPNKTGEHIRAAYNETVIFPDGTKSISTKGIMSNVYCLTAKDNPQAASRLSPVFTVFEESGIWKKGLLLDTRNIIRPSQYSEGKKTGWSYYIATGGDMEMSVNDVKKMFYNPDEYGLLKFVNRYESNDGSYIAHFTPAWKYVKIDKHGNSHRDESIKYIEAQKENYKKANERLLYTIMNPLHPSDIFTITGGNFFGDDTILHLNERLRYLTNNRATNLGMYGNYFWIDSSNKRKGVYWSDEPDEWGMRWVWKLNDPFTIIDENGRKVIPDGIYKQGTDSYDKDKAPTSDSLGSSHIIKGYNKYEMGEGYGRFECRILGRPTEEMGGAMYFYDLVLRMNVAWNARNLIEYSNLRIFQYYETAGMLDYLSLRPDFVISNWVKLSKTVNRFGIDPNTKIYWLKTLRDFLIANNFEQINNLFNEEQIAHFIKFKLVDEYNCDETISSALCVVQLEEEKLKMSSVETNDANSDSYDEFFSYALDDEGNIIPN